MIKLQKDLEKINLNKISILRHLEWIICLRLMRKKFDQFFSSKFTVQIKAICNDNLIEI